MGLFQRRLTTLVHIIIYAYNLINKLSERAVNRLSYRYKYERSISTEGFTLEPAGTSRHVVPW